MGETKITIETDITVTIGEVSVHLTRDEAKALRDLLDKELKGAPVAAITDLSHIFGRIGGESREESMLEKYGREYRQPDPWLGLDSWRAGPMYGPQTTCIGDKI